MLGSLVSVYYYLRVLVSLFMETPSAGQEREAAERPPFSAPLAGATVLVCGFLVLLCGFIQPYLVNGFVDRALDGFR